MSKRSLALRPATSVVIGLLALAAICPAEAAKIIQIDDLDMYAVYTALLAERPYDWKSVAVVNVTSPEPDWVRRSCPELQTLTSEWAGAVSDYRDRNRQAYRLKWKFQVPRRKVSLIYPNDPDRPEQRLQLSAVGFNRTKTHAIVTYSDADGGESLTVERAEDRWKIVTVAEGGYSCMWFY